MRRIIKSPIQGIELSAGRDQLMIRMMNDLLKVHNQFVAKVKDLDEIIKKKPGQKGDRGSDSIIPGPAGKTPEKGIDYFTDEDIKKITSFIKGEMVDYFTKNEEKKIINALKNNLSNLVKEPTIPVDEIIDGLKKSLKSSDIVDLDERLKTLKRQIDASSNWRGGGDTVIAGTNITITANSEGQKIISSIGGGGVDTETPGGTVDGSNDTFTVTSEPKWVVSDGITYFDGRGYTYSALSITMDIPPNSYIEAIL